MIFGKLNMEKISHEMLQTCPSHLSDVATLKKRSHFQQYYSYIVMIVYVIL